MILVLYLNGNYMQRRVEIFLFTEFDFFFHQLKFHTFTVEYKLMIFRWIW